MYKLDFDCIKVVLASTFELEKLRSTLPQTNSEFAPENGWLEYYFPIGEAYFQGLLLLVSGRVSFGWSPRSVVTEKHHHWNPVFHFFPSTIHY